MPIRVKSLARRAITSLSQNLPQPAKRIMRASAAAVIHRLPDKAKRSYMAEVMSRILPVNSNDAVVCAQMRHGHKMMVDMRSGSENACYYTGDYDDEHMALILALAKPEWVVLDVGANIGLWTVPLARAVAQVYAFEALPRNYSRLNENVSLNDLGTVLTFGFGLSDQCATVGITLREDIEGGSGTGNAAIVPDTTEPWLVRESIEVRPLDSLALPLKRLDFIKLDIEGHEDHFLRGAARTIEGFRPFLLMEVNTYYYQLRNLDPTILFTELMENLGYCCALQIHGSWRIAPLSDRRRRVEDVFLLPKERAEEIVQLLNTTQRLQATAGIAGHDGPSLDHGFHRQE